MLHYLHLRFLFSIFKTEFQLMASCLNYKILKTFFSDQSDKNCRKINSIVH